LQLCNKSYSKIFLRRKNNVYPVHKPAAVDYFMFNVGEFLFNSNFEWTALIKENSPFGCKKSWSGIATYLVI
jgi:hypothetical protein